MRPCRRRHFRKAHIVCECSAPEKPILAWKLTAPWHGNSPQLIPLLEQVSDSLDDVVGDSAYASRANAQYVADRGGIPYLRPRANATPRSKRPPAWKHMVHLYQNRPGRLNALYRYRVNVDGRFSSTKRCQAPFFRVRHIWTQRREYGWRVVAHNAELCARSRLRAELS